MTCSRILQTLLWLTYPAIVFFGLKILEPRVIAIILILLLILRWRHKTGQLLASFSRLDFVVFATLLTLAGAAAIANSEILLLFYPAAVNASMLLLFGLSLKNPPPMVERFARLQDPNLSPAGIRYTRHVTQLWCAFFVGNGAAATYTALWASREIWALYNGFIAYVLMGMLFASEWLFRRYYIARHT